MVVFGFVPRCSIFGKPDYHPRFRRGTYRHPRIIQGHSTPCRRSASSPTGVEKCNTPCGFMMFRMGGAQKHSPGSTPPWRTIDRTIRGPRNRPSRQWHPKSIIDPTSPLQTAQISWLMVQSRLRRHRPNSRNGQLRSMISALSASSRSRTPMADRIAWLRDGMADVTRATNVEKRRNNSK